MKLCVSTLLILLGALSAVGAGDVRVGPTGDGGYVVSTKQLIRPAGRSLEFSGHPMDLVLSPDNKTLYAKTTTGLLVVDAMKWVLRQRMDFGEADLGSYHGIAVTRNGLTVYAGTSQSALLEMRVGADGMISIARKIDVRGLGKGNSTPCGIALSPDEKTAYVCLSRSNSLAVVDLDAGKLVKEIPVGVSPYDVELSADGQTAWVSNWGGRLPREIDKTETSSGTRTRVDIRSIACSGSVSLVDVEQGKEILEVNTGLHPCDLFLDDARNTLYIANANSDTISVIDTVSRKVIRAIDVKPDKSLPFGSAPNAIALSKDGKILYAANGGNNAVAVVNGDVSGYIPTGWYPGAVATDGKYLYIANIKGFGTRYISPDTKLAPSGDKRPERGWVIFQHLGTLQKVRIPGNAKLAQYTKQVYADSRIPQILRAAERAQIGVGRKPVPERIGEPSPIQHVVYIIKENKTYDQVFGDMPGNSDPKLCVFGREVTPNHHALADQFVLLDNYYCNGVRSADGHQWATQGIATDYMEKAFGGWPRSYPYEGNDPMAYSSAGFIWDNALLHGLSFRNYGEMAENGPMPKASFKDLLEDSRNKGGKYRFSAVYKIETLRRYSCPDSPGWTLAVPDQVRADIFLKELAGSEKTGEWPNLITLLLPNDHTSGLSPGSPTPRAFVADNDLALGRIVEAISKSRFWSSTCIFVIEDDPQSGYDHVDGHRSICLVISPYVKRKAIVSKFYNQTSVLHTMELMLGLPPMTQMDAMAPVMRECFTDKPDLTPYAAIPSNVPLDETNPARASLSGDALHWADECLAQPFDELDKADEDILNKAIWYSAKGFDTPYPAAFAGAHGKGLKALNLALSPNEHRDKDPD